MRPGRDADHSIPSNAETKNACSYTSTPPYVFVASCLIQLRMSSRTSTSFSKGTLPHLTPFPSANNRSLTFSSYITLSFTQFYYLPDRWGWQEKGPTENLELGAPRTLFTRISAFEMQVHSLNTKIHNNTFRWDSASLIIRWPVWVSSFITAQFPWSFENEETLPKVHKMKYRCSLLVHVIRTRIALLNCRR